VSSLIKKLCEMQDTQLAYHQAAEAMEAAKAEFEAALRALPADEIRPHTGKWMRVGDWVYRFAQASPLNAASVESQYVPDLTSDPIFEPTRRKRKRNDD